MHYRIDGRHAGRGRSSDDADGCSQCSGVDVADASGGRLRAFFRREHRRLFGALVLVTGDREEAFELMQDAFLSLWHRWDRTPRIEDPTAYLFRTAMNGFRMRRRRAAVAARRFLRPRDASDPLGAIDARDAVDRGLARATPRQRAALVLTALMGYPSEEAGRILGIRPATVRVLAKSARDTLRAALIEEEERDG